MNVSPNLVERQNSNILNDKNAKYDRQLRYFKKLVLYFKSSNLTEKLSSKANGQLFYNPLIYQEGVFF